jgi:hypothetical protein
MRSPSRGTVADTRAGVAWAIHLGAPSRKGYAARCSTEQRAAPMSGYSGSSAHTRAAIRSASSWDRPRLVAITPRDPSGNVTSRISVSNGPGSKSSDMHASLDDPGTITTNAPAE